MYKTILVPIDMSHAAEGKSIIDVATRYGGDGTKFILLNVVEDIPNWAAVQLPANIIDNSLDAARDELKAIATASGLKMEVEVRTGHSYNTILDVAAEKNADLIIIASHKPGLQDYFLGSTAAKVVRHAKCSVLVVR
ncbi:MAG: universal stress protein [Gammaproteobacteria bacterium]|nr:universal stress protein [Gammaproteobacteria bacterium]MDH3447738.1 universal stress protein [Gammaproteobacteria bacterium]